MIKRILYLIIEFMLFIMNCATLIIMDMLLENELYAINDRGIMVIQLCFSGFQMIITLILMTNNLCYLISHAKNNDESEEKL